MTTTPNLGITEVAAADTDKPDEINAALTQFDTAFCSAVTEALTGSTFSLTQSDYQNYSVFTFTGYISGCTITLPSFGRAIIVINRCTSSSSSLATPTLSFQVGSAVAVVAITDANPHLIYCDGGNNVYKAS